MLLVWEWNSCGHASVCRCFLMSHLKTGNSKSPSVVYRSVDRHQVRAVGNVLVVELYRHFIVTCKEIEDQLLEETQLFKGSTGQKGRVCFIPGSWATYETPHDPSFLSSKEISARLGPSTAMDRPPAPASRVHTLNSATWAQQEWDEWMFKRVLYSSVSQRHALYLHKHKKFNNFSRWHLNTFPNLFLLFTKIS